MQLFFNFPRSSWQSQCLRPLLIGVAALFMLSSCSVLPKDPRISQSADNPNALLGLPSSATSFNANDYLISRPQYVLSYNRSKAIPNWASWQLNQTWLGSRPRIPFEPDQTLPSSWEKVSPNDYTGSGFDRGHVVPAADRNKTADDSRAVFLMTNIFPQAPDNNQGPWAQLESYCRDLVAQGKELYIVAGGRRRGGEQGKKEQRGRSPKVRFQCLPLRGKLSSCPIARVLGRLGLPSKPESLRSFCRTNRVLTLSTGANTEPR